MRFENISVLLEDFSVASEMDVRTEGVRIAALHPHGAANAQGEPQASEERVIDGRGKLLMPGFINAHAHAPMTLMRGYGENMPLMAWLEQKIFPFEDELTGTDCYHATLLAMAESFAHGIVSSSDSYFFCEDIVCAATEAGAKLNVSRGLSFFEETLDTASFRPLQESKELYGAHHGGADGRIRVDIGLHAEYTATPALIDAVSALSQETGAPVHVHVSETYREHEACKARNGGRTPMQVLADGGVFEQGGQAAHCVWVEDVDIELLAEKGVTVVSCPVSNMKLASGIAQIPALLEKGVRVALGTDGAASNNSLNFFEELKLLSLAAKARFEDPTLITPKQALFAATRAGALAQGRMDCGMIKEGCRADFIVLDLSAPSLNPVFDLPASLVFAASSRDILMTVVDGRVVYEEGEFPTIDLARVNFEVEQARGRILKVLSGGNA